MLSKSLDFDVELRARECTILSNNFMKEANKQKQIIFLYGTTGTGKTSLVEYFFNIKIRKEHKNTRYYYYNIIRTRSERLCQLFSILKNNRKDKFFVVLDEIDKADSSLLTKTIKTLLEISFENNLVYFILIANDFRFFEKKFKDIEKKDVLKIPFPPFDKKLIKNYLRKIFIPNKQNDKKKKKFIEDMINLVAVKIGNKKPDIRKSLVLCQELIANRQQETIETKTRLPESAKKILDLITYKFDKESWIDEKKLLALLNTLNKKDSKLNTSSARESLEVLCSLGKLSYKLEKKRPFYMYS